ncbi:MAG: methionyl-tRNA formyltransferase [Clostridia bacterium]|nr:methionyl-tRNA formyltransferase [Clostridia bacterium]
MADNKTRVLFMGTPDFAEASLKALYETGLYDISVVTQPEKPRGRGYGMAESDVKKYALSVGLPVYQPEKLRDGSFEATLSEIDPEVIVVAAYGKILPGYILDYPPHGCVNVHGSLLPEYRGAAPIQRAIIDGRKKTGITIMKMDAGLDTGDVLFTKEVEISDSDDAGSLFEKMAAAGADLIKNRLPLILKGEISPIKQDDSRATYAPKIEKSECVIDFTKPAGDIACLIRGLSPAPLASFRRADGTQIKINEAEVSGEVSDVPAGTVIQDGDKMEIVCGDGRAIAPLSVTPSGKRKMTAAEYLRGHRIPDGGEPVLRDGQ